MTALGQTIAAIATAIVPQQGSVGIIRVSGPDAVAIAHQLFRASGNQVWESHRILYGLVQDPATQRTVDEALLLLMLAPRSYTREDVVEFHCHGGIIAVQEVLKLCIQAGARLASPGEFTLRAFLNGRIDLAQAESIADLVNAQSSRAAQVALAGIKGKLSQPIHQFKKRCLDILAEVEARIDFEDDLPILDQQLIQQKLQELLIAINEILSTARQGLLLRTGLKVAILGRPNVGKSSLLNAWSRTDRAIVTDLPGTTRDVVETQLVVSGIPIQVLDTAGIRETQDIVEQLGVKRSHQAGLSADLVIFVIDAIAGWSEEDNTILSGLGDRPAILVINKVDLASQDQIKNISYPELFLARADTVAAQGIGISELETALLNALNLDNLRIENIEWSINERQEASLARTKTALLNVWQAMEQKLPLDFWTIDLRAALHALSEITGESISESVLDLIFSRFCIGK
jgi:tRNA modification GTPase